MKTFSHNGLTFNFLELGPRQGETIVLLHGFPASAESWQPVFSDLVAHGYHVLVLEQRGYSEQARPTKYRDYRLSLLVEDVRALLESVACKKAHIVGHDWGGVVAWAFTAKHPDLVISLTAISTPHPRALCASLWRSTQLYRARHMLFFQLPYLPEWFLCKNQGRNLKKALIHTGLSPKTAEKYANRMQDKERLTGALNWYRALPMSLREARRIGKITRPTLYIYGGKDAYMSRKAALLSEKYLTSNSRIERIPSETHWSPEESPQLVAKTVLAFIQHPNLDKKSSS